MEEQLWNACQRGDAEAVKKIMAENPDVDINWRNPLDISFWRDSIIEVACACDNDHIVLLLLARPDVDLNNGDKEAFHTCEYTALSASCYYKSPHCTKVLLEDPRFVLFPFVCLVIHSFLFVRVVASGLRGYCSLRTAIFRHHIDPIEVWIASGREIDLRKFIVVSFSFILILCFSL